MPFERDRLPATPGIPQLQRLVFTATGDPQTVRAERHAGDNAVVAPEGMLIDSEQPKEVVVLPATEVSATSIEVLPSDAGISLVPILLRSFDLARIEQPLGTR